MRALLLAPCLLFGSVTSGAFAQERASLSASDAMGLCEAWLTGALREQDVQLQGWRRLEGRRPENIMLMPMGSSGAMDQVSLIREDFPDAEQRHCAFRWRFDTAAGHLADASAALSARGFRIQTNPSTASEEAIAGSRIDQAVALANASVNVVPCQRLVIGPHQNPCAGETVAELNLYVVETRQKSQSE